MTSVGYLDFMLISANVLRTYLKADAVRFRRLLKQASVYWTPRMKLNEAQCLRVMTVFYTIRGEGILRRNGALHNLDGGSETFEKHHSSSSHD